MIMKTTINKAKQQSADNIYFADNENHVIRKIDSDGNISTVAGKGENSGIVAMVAKQQMLILILHLVSQSMPMETCILEITVIM